MSGNLPGHVWPLNKNLNLDQNLLSFTICLELKINSYLAPTSLESINESEINDPELSEQINIPPEPHAVTNHSLSQPVPLPPENQLDIEIPNLQPANGEKP